MQCSHDMDIRVVIILREWDLSLVWIPQGSDKITMDFKGSWYGWQLFHGNISWVQYSHNVVISGPDMDTVLSWYRFCKVVMSVIRCGYVTVIYWYDRSWYECFYAMISMQSGCVMDTLQSWYWHCKSAIYGWYLCHDMLCVLVVMIYGFLRVVIW